MRIHLLCRSLFLFIAATASAQSLHEQMARHTPDWFREGVTYQIIPRSMSAEGTLKGAEAQLERLSEIGINTIYLLPVNVADDDMDKSMWSPAQASSGFNNPRNPYRAADYFHVDPEYGTDQDLKDFVDHAHALGQKVLLDLVFFHSGPSAQVLKQHPEYYLRDEKGELVIGRWRFPVFDYSRKDVRAYFRTVMCYYVADFNVDGFRLDVADRIPLDFWEEARRALEEIKPDILLCAEGDKRENTLYAFDANYGWVVRKAVIQLVSNYLNKKETDAAPIRAAHEKYTSECPRGTLSWNFMDNHDITTKNTYNARHERVWGYDMTTIAMAFTFAIDGVPFLFNGEDVCYDKPLSMYAHEGHWIDWDTYCATPHARERAANIRKWADMRKQYSALSRGETQWLDNDQPKAVVSFLRHDGVSKDVLFVGNFSDTNVKVRLSDGSKYKLEPWGFVFQAK